MSKQLFRTTTNGPNYAHLLDVPHNLFLIISALMGTCPNSGASKKGNVLLVSLYNHHKKTGDPSKRHTPFVRFQPKSPASIRRIPTRTRSGRISSALEAGTFAWAVGCFRALAGAHGAIQKMVGDGFLSSTRTRGSNPNPTHQSKTRMEGYLTTTPKPSI